MIHIYARIKSFLIVYQFLFHLTVMANELNENIERGYYRIINSGSSPFIDDAIYRIPDPQIDSEYLRGRPFAATTATYSIVKRVKANESHSVRRTANLSQGIVVNK